MRKIITYTLFFVLAIATKGFAQKTTFEERAKEIATNIQTITTEEKRQLKVELAAIDEEVKSGKITAEQGAVTKEKIAKERAENIERKVAVQQAELEKLIDEQVAKGMEAQVAEKKTDSIFIGVKSDSLGYTIEFPAMKFNKKAKKDKISYSRTQSQFVFAIGLNNLATDGDLSTVEGNDFKGAKSHFFEWGYALNTRIFKNSNFFHFKYGMSLMYNNLQPKNEMIFVENGNQTVLGVYDEPLRKSKFRSVQLVVPLHLEFDFTPGKCKDGTTQFRIHRSLRMGIGGYAGINVKNKQKLFTESGDKIKQKKDFNTSTFIYGTSAYIGFEDISLYVKYDLNDMFTNNIVPQNNISYGIRFDFN